MGKSSFSRAIVPSRYHPPPFRPSSYKSGSGSGRVEARPGAFLQAARPSCRRGNIDKELKSIKAAATPTPVSQDFVKTADQGRLWQPNDRLSQEDRVRRSGRHID